MLDDYLQKRQNYSLYIFASQNKFRRLCQWFVKSKWCDNILLAFIGLNCITLAMERPTILSNSLERAVLSFANNVFTAIFASEMLIKVIIIILLYSFCIDDNSVEIT